jgi:hypothetical protein
LVRSSRGHDMGWIGVTVDGRSALPPARQVLDRIQSFVEQITKSQSNSTDELYRR